MPTLCPLCDDTGLRVVTRPDGSRFAEVCDCRIQQRVLRRLSRARIPRRYEHCSFESFDTHFPSSHKSIQTAKVVAQKFVVGYPVESPGTGILFVGNSGLGKTHLALSILKSLIVDKQATGVYWDHKGLLDHMRSIYDAKIGGAEKAIVDFATKADLLVLDDLGEPSPSDWSWDMTSYLLNERYNNQLPTIITTNLANTGVTGMNDVDPNDTFAVARQAMTQATLGDRIGERMRSRLQEMCIVVTMQGEDFRQTIKRARNLDADIKQMALQHFLEMLTLWKEEHQNFYAHPGNEKMLVDAAQAKANGDIKQVTPEVLDRVFQELQQAGYLFPNPQSIGSRSF